MSGMMRRTVTRRLARSSLLPQSCPSGSRRYYNEPRPARAIGHMVPISLLNLNGATSPP